MREDEAKTKWCPMIRATDESGQFPASNRMIIAGGGLAKLSPEICCIASDCMAWRDSSVTTYNDGPDGKLTTVSLVVGGFCGLASKP